MFPNSVLSYHKNWDRWQTSDQGKDGWISTKILPNFVPIESTYLFLSLFRELE